MTRSAPLSALPFAALAAGTLAACAPLPPPAAPAQASPQEAFWRALTSHCGKAYAGGLASTDARDADWAGKRMVAHWAQCSADRVAIAFHVEDADEIGGWNRSRTWIVTRERSGAGARFALSHDHRHDDGEADAVTFYGGITADGGTARAQDFPVDDASIALFTREGLAASLTNVWRIEIDPAGTRDAAFAYQLTRRNDPSRLFRVEIDASAPVAAPPPAWGW